MNIEEARNLRQGTMIYHMTLKNADGTPMRARVTSVKTWKRDLERIEVRVKRGLSEYATFEGQDLHTITTDEEEAIANGAV